MKFIPLEKPLKSPLGYRNAGTAGSFDLLKKNMRRAAHFSLAGFFILWCIVLFFHAPAFAKTVKQYKKEISTKSQELQDLEKTLKAKKAEKEKYLKSEQDIKKELAKLEKELKGLQEKQAGIQKNIRKAEQHLKKTSEELKYAGWEKGQWKKTLHTETDRWNRDYNSYFRLYADPVDERLRLQSLYQKKARLMTAAKREFVSKVTLEKWQLAEKKLLDLKAQLEQTAGAQHAAKGKKEALLKTTTGRRIAAEEEIKELKASSEALKGLIDTLLKEKKKTEDELVANQVFQKKKGQLPWPVEGSVVTKFGRNKHPEFDTYLVCNGFKIKTHKNAQVRAVSKGEVIFNGPFRAYGQMVIVDHGGSFYTVYGNLTESLVEEGQKLDAGATIGTLHENGDNILYFEVRNGSGCEDPSAWLK